MLFRILIVAIAAITISTNALSQNLMAANDPASIADLRIAQGDKDIAEAWLIAPTMRYPHFVQGSNYEAGGLRLRTREGRNLTLLLDETLVFEDRQPRLTDLDDDGRDEIILVLTSLEKGASLAAYSIVDDEIRLKAKTPFIGRPYRWLNPAGIADFNGDGKLDVAFVAMPHLAKRLEYWTLSDHGFRQVGKIEDVSNHKNGSMHTGMSVTADFDGDGITDLAIPDGSRRFIRVISFAGSKEREIERIPLPFSANGTFSIRKTNKGQTLSIPLDGGETVEVKF